MLPYLNKLSSFNRDTCAALLILQLHDFTVTMVFAQMFLCRCCRRNVNHSFKRYSILGASNATKVTRIKEEASYNIRDIYVHSLYSSTRDDSCLFRLVGFPKALAKLQTTRHVASA